MSNNLNEFFKNHKYILAPMAGVCDVAFRHICIENGCDLTYSEMISSMGLEYANEKTKDKLKLANNESKFVVQLFGHDSYVMAKQIEAICDLFDVYKTKNEHKRRKLLYIDINMACPAPKIVKKGDGAGLMCDIKKAQEIVSQCCKVSKVPITVKFRRGFNWGEDTSYEFAKTIEQAGASGLCIHGRYAKQYYRDKADWICIKKIADNVDVPVIGSGDIIDKNSAEKAFRTGVIAIMIGRAARGNPLIFNTVKGINKNADLKDKLTLARRQLDLFMYYKLKNICDMRKHCIWYTKGMPNSSYARKKFSKCSSYSDFIDVFNKIEEAYNF